MDPIKNPFSPGAGSPPSELVGRDPILEQPSSWRYGVYRAVVRRVYDSGDTRVSTTSHYPLTTSHFSRSPGISFQNCKARISGVVDKLRQMLYSLYNKYKNRSLL